MLVMPRVLGAFLFFSCTCILWMQRILAHVHTHLHIFTFQHVALYFYIICCYFHSHHFHLVWYVSHTCQSRMFSQFSRVVLTTGQTTCGLLHAWNLFIYSLCHSQFCFAQSSRANGVEFSGQTTCGLLHTWHISFSTLTFCSTLFVVSLYFILVSHKVHVRTGLNNQVRPRADCCTPATLLLYSYILFLRWL